MPIFQLKHTLVDPIDLHGVIKIHLGSHENPLFSTYFTRLDQALIAWGMAVALIFWVAQAYWIDWHTQAVVWSTLSCGAIAMTSRLTWFWGATRNQRWIIYGWAMVVAVGLMLTDYGIFHSSSVILSNLCGLWLGLSAIGYLITGIGIHAQALILVGAIHGATIPCIKLLPASQFLITGTVMAASLFTLATFHWDHQ